MAEPYKYQWARSVARKTLAADLEAIRKNMEDTGGMNEFLGDIGGEKPSVAQLVRRTKELTGTGPALPKEPGQMKMGIVGAGVAGLFTAMVFDWLNSQFSDTELNIDYDIFEAGPENRLGGRLYTHHFSERPHDYYDVGAMRFPNNNVMKRTFQLFELLRQPEDKEKLKLLPYYLDDLENVCPSYFNDVQKVGKVWPEDRSVTDPYKINSGLPEDSQIPEEILKENPSDLVSRALAGFIGVTAQLFEEFRAWIKATEKGEKWKPREDKRTPEQAWWDHLMKSDNMSVRQFLRSGDNGIGFPRGPEYNYNTIEWLETATYGTGWYDQALSECVLEELDFETPKDKCQYWWCVDGGSQEMAKLMAKKIKKKVQFNSQITAIDAQIFERKKPGMRPQDHVPMKLKIKDRKAQDYFAIFNSTTLAALQRMDLKDAGLLYGTKQAIRALGYGASCKVAIKFRTPWWQLEPFKISMGGVARTDLPLRVCVYPSYNIEKVEGEHWDPDGSSVLLCSYTWGQDAQRLGSLISNDTPKNEEELKRVLLHNLALLHADPNINVTENPTAKNTYDNLLSHLYEQYETHHAWDWYRDQNMSGAFAYYGPGQFSNMWQEILKPNSFAQLYLVGEAASSHHAWIVGALESVIRAIYVLFEGLENSNEDDNYEVYQQVMNLLEFGQKERPTDEEIEKSREVEEKQQKEDKKTKEEKGEVPFPKGLPFFPLPAEMPKRQGFTKRGENVTHSPEKAAKNEGDLAWPAAAAALSMLEAFFELVYETEKDVKRAKENVEKAKSRGVDAGTSTDE